MKSRIVLAQAGLFALVLAGCSSGHAARTGAGGGATPSSAPTDMQLPTDEPTPEATSDVAPFGAGFHWDDGLAVTVSAPRPYRASAYAAGGEHSKAKVAFTVTITNGTAAPWDPVLLNVSVQSGTTEGDRIFDDRLTDLTTKVLPHRAAKVLMAFGVDAPSDLVVEVTPDFDHNPVVFASSAG